MVLAVTNLGNNPQQPAIIADAFIPDQLIAGRLLVTEPATITGSANLLRGTVLGRVGEGTLTATAGKAFATGSVVVAAAPSNGDTVTIGGTALTFSTAPGYEEAPFNGKTVYILPTTALNAQALMDALVASTDSNLIKFTYSLSGSTVTTNAAVPGTGGNSLTLATSNSSAFTVSGSTLSGGTANTGNATVGSISAGVNIKPGNYSAVCLTATTANVFDPGGAEIGQLTFGTAFVDPQINFTITAGGTPCAAGDTFIIAAAKGSGSYKLATSSATDGSNVPAAILIDDAAAAGGDVAGGVYVSGEFNANAIILDPSISLLSATNALRPLGIYLKSSVSASDPS